MRVLIIGLGSIARKHVIALRKIRRDVTIQALRTTAGTGQAEADPGIDHIFSWDDVVKPDFILISNPTAFHRAALERSLAYGCPLLIEKPVFDKLGKEEERVLEQIGRAGVNTYVACNLRFHPVIRFLKEYLSQHKDKVNEVSVYCGSYLPAWRPGTDFTKGYSANPDMGGGAHLDLIHELDYLNYMWGLPEGVQSLLMNRSSLSIRAVDSARYLLDYGHFSASVTLNYFRRDAKRTVEIVSENDTLVGDLINCTVTRASDRAVLFHEADFNMAVTYAEQMEYFITHKEGRMMNDIQEASEVLRVALPRTVSE
jgi:predicted dehydrogenase